MQDIRGHILLTMPSRMVSVGAVVGLPRPKSLCLAKQLQHSLPCMAMALALNTPAAACTGDGKPSHFKGMIHGRIMTYLSLLVPNHTSKRVV